LVSRLNHLVGVFYASLKDGYGIHRQIK